MAKLLLFSLIIATLAIPMRAAGAHPSARVGFRKMLFWFVAFDVFYLIGMIYLYPRLS